MDFTVEVTTAPVRNGDYSRLYRVLDAVPGSLLLEDPDEPTLIVPVDAPSPMKAAMFLDGIATLTEIELVSGEVYPTPPDDFEPFSDDTSSRSQVVEAVTEWVEDSEPIRGQLREEHGRLVVACG